MSDIAKASMQSTDRKRERLNNKSVVSLSVVLPTVWRWFLRIGTRWKARCTKNHRRVVWSNKSFKIVSFKFVTFIEFAVNWILSRGKDGGHLNLNAVIKLTTKIILGISKKQKNSSFWYLPTDKFKENDKFDGKKWNFSIPQKKEFTFTLKLLKFTFIYV